MKKIRNLKRIKAVSEISIILGSILALSSGILLFSTATHFLYLASGFFVGIMLVIIGGAIFASLRTTVYTTIIPTYFDGDIDNLTFTPFHGISAYQVAATEHLKDADRFTSMNLFTGSIYQYPFIISHVTLQHVTNQNTNHISPYFKGPIIMFDINYSFNMRTHILSEGQPLTFKNYQKHDDTNALHKAFTVYTDDTTRTSQLLNTYMAKAINRLFAQHPTLNISFLDKKLIITMNDDVAAFSMKLFKRSHLERLETLKKDIEILKTLIVATNIYIKS